MIGRRTWLAGAGALAAALAGPAAGNLPPMNEKKATPEFLLTLDWEPWAESEGSVVPLPTEWIAMAQTHCLTLRMAEIVMFKSKGKLAEILGPATCGR
jgi:hypothetical protein